MEILDPTPTMGVLINSPLICLVWRLMFREDTKKGAATSQGIGIDHENSSRHLVILFNKDGGIVKHGPVWDHKCTTVLETLQARRSSCGKIICFAPLCIVTNSRSCMLPSSRSRNFVT
eukprot:scaffold1605_cov365-Pavlova_lutheri.AAC.9